MPAPTTGEFLNQTTPAASTGDQTVVVQSDGATPSQSITFVPKRATGSLCGTVVPDGTTIVVGTGGTAGKITALPPGGAQVLTANYTAITTDNGTLLSFNSASAVMLTLPAVPPSAKWNIAVENIGAGVLTINRNGLLIDLVAANLTLNQNLGLGIFTDGTNYLTERGSGFTSPLTTKGDLYGRSTVDARFPVGADGQSIVADSSQPLGMRWAARVSVAGITVDGGGSTPATGSKGFIQIPFAGTITGWTLIGDVSGSASIDVKKSTYAAFPTNTSIVASAPPALSSAQNATSTTLTGWTTAVAAGDVLEFVLSSATTLKRLTLELQITRS